MESLIPVIDQKDIPIYGYKTAERFISPSGQTFTSKEVYYTQLIRLADVFLIGPILIYASTFKTLPAYLRVLLFVIGVATIIYNGRNYIKTIK
jgi:hypothetical protein